MQNNDLISRSALLDSFDAHWVTEYDEAGFSMEYKAVPVGAIETAPAVDAEPVRHDGCALCDIRETGNGMIVYPDIRWISAIPKWISVKDALPAYGERVLITEGTCVFEAYRSISNKWVRSGIGWAEDVTHWAQLPEPPKEDA